MKKICRFLLSLLSVAVIFSLISNIDLTDWLKNANFKFRYSIGVEDCESNNEVKNALVSDMIEEENDNRKYISDNNQSNELTADNFDYEAYCLGCYKSADSMNVIRNYYSIPNKSLCYYIVNDITQKSSFKIANFAWNFLTFDISSLGSKYWDTVSEYESIIFNMLNSALNSNSIIDILNNDNMKNSFKILNTISKCLDTKNLSTYSISNGRLYKSGELLAEGTEDKLKQFISDDNSLYYTNIFYKDLSFISEVFNTSKDIYSFAKKLNQYETLSNFGIEIENILYSMKNNTDSSDTAFQIALSDCINVVHSSTGTLLTAIMNGTYTVENLVYKQFAKKLWNEILETITSSKIITNGVLIAQTIGKTACNICFSTDKELNQLLRMEYLINVETTMVYTVSSYLSTDDYREIATCVEMFKQLYLLDATYSQKFYSIRNGQLIGGLNDEDYKLVSDYITSHSNMYTRDFDSIKPAVLQTCGDNLYWIIIDGKLLVIGYGAMTSSNWSKNITSVSFSSYLLSIKHEAFLGCALQSVTIPNSVETIYFDAFRGCTSLQSVTMIPGSVKSCIYGDAFNGCTSLQRVTIGNGVIHICERAFYNCKNLETLVIPDSVTSICEEAFHYCSGLKNLTIPASSGIYIGNPRIYTEESFPQSKNIENVHITKGTGMMQNFYDYGAPWYNSSKTLKTLVIDEGVKNISSSAFSGCTALENLTIPNSITNIGDYAFSCCTSLQSITIPDSVKSIGNYAFSGCTSLQNITIPDSVTSIGVGAFFHCSGAMEITIGAGITSIEPSTFEGCSSVKSIIIPNGVTSIGWRAFEGCSSAESIIIPNGVTFINDEVFKDCSGVKSIVIPDSVTSIGWRAFENCTELKNLTIPITTEMYSTNTDSYQSFFYSRSIENIHLTKGTGTTGFGSYRPWDFSKSTLKTVIIDEGIKRVSNFSDCTALESVIIPKSVTTIGRRAFSGCSSLKSLVFNNDLVDIYDSFDTIASNVKIIGRCGSRAYEYAQKYSRTFEPNAHYESSSWQTVIPSTCLNNGIIQKKCTYCGEFLGDTKSVPLVDCSPGDWIITVESTCTTEGAKERHCKWCDKLIESAAVPPSHKKSAGEQYELYGIKFTKYVCTECGATLSDESISSGTIGYAVCNISNVVVDKSKTSYITLDWNVLSYSMCYGVTILCDYIPGEFTVTNAGTSSSFYFYSGKVKWDITNLSVGAHFTSMQMAFPSYSSSYYSGEIGSIYVTCSHQNHSITKNDSGEYVHDCQFCGQRWIEHLCDHTNCQWEVTTPCTESENGLISKCCKDCNYIIENKELPAGSHFDVKSNENLEIGDMLIKGFEQGIIDVLDYFDFSGYDVTVAETENGLGTGSQINLSLENETIFTYYIVIDGDITGDGFCDAFDVSRTIKYINNFDEPEESAYFEAMDICSDGFLDATDLAYILSIANYE